MFWPTADNSWFQIKKSFLRNCILLAYIEDEPELALALALALAQCVY